MPNLPTAPRVLTSQVRGDLVTSRELDIVKVAAALVSAAVLLAGLYYGRHILVPLAIAFLASRGRSDALQRAGNHALLVTSAASLLPHALKAVFDQTRPDRQTVLGHLHGIPFSGKRDDAFPSGHALHMGALASAASTLPAGPRRAIQTIAVGLSLTRIMVLAHWASDVVAGFALGAILERLLRLWTGYPLKGSEEDDHANS